MKTHVQSILLMLLLLQAAQATMVITFGVPATYVNDTPGSYYTIGDKIGLTHQVTFANGSHWARVMIAEIVLADQNGNGLGTALVYQTTVSAHSEFSYDPGYTSAFTALGSSHKAYLWGSYVDGVTHLMTTEIYNFTQGM